jgi:hypothetical protein
MDTTTKGAIPSTAREGGFAVADGRRNLGIATIKFFAIERSKEYVATRKKYTLKCQSKSSYHIKQRKVNSVMA